MEVVFEDRYCWFYAFVLLKRIWLCLRQYWAENYCCDLCNAFGEDTIANCILCWLGYGRFVLRFADFLNFQERFVENGRG